MEKKNIKIILGKSIVILFVAHGVIASFFPDELREGSLEHPSNFGGGYVMCNTNGSTVVFSLIPSVVEIYSAEMSDNNN